MHKKLKHAILGFIGAVVVTLFLLSTCGCVATGGSVIAVGGGDTNSVPIMASAGGATTVSGGAGSIISAKGQQSQPSMLKWIALGVAVTILLVGAWWFVKTFVFSSARLTVFKGG